jgi:septal ring factor EnvC (AmiA/AmiB activator)
LFLLCTTSCQKKPVVVQQPTPLLDQAQVAFDSNRFEMAVRLLEDHLSQNPSGPRREEAIFLLAASYSIPESRTFDPLRAAELLEDLSATPNTTAAPLAQLSRALYRMDRRGAELAAQVAFLESAQRQAAEQLSQARSEADSLRARIAELESEKHTLSQNLELRKERINELIRRLESAEARNTRLQTEVESMKKVLESMKKIDLPKQ